MPFVKKKKTLDDMLVKCQYCRKKSKWDTCNSCWKLVTGGEAGLRKLSEILTKVHSKKRR
jgi:hypothetical protein